VHLLVIVQNRKKDLPFTITDVAYFRTGKVSDVRRNVTAQLTCSVMYLFGDTTEGV